MSAESRSAPRSAPQSSSGPAGRPTPRERARAELMTDLLAAARARLEQDGADLSLRAVARDLGLSSSAVYRYVESRDALLTLLVIESYDAVGKVAEQAAERARAAGAGPADTWLAVARAVRAWAIADPRSFELIYGTPVRGYQAPQDTVRAAVRLWAVLISIVLEAQRDRTLRPTAPDFDPDGVVTPDTYAFGAQLGAGAPHTLTPDEERATVRTISLFTSLVGAITAEVFGHLRGVDQDADALFDVTIATTAAGIGLHVDLAAAATSRPGARPSP